MGHYVYTHLHNFTLHQILFTLSREGGKMGDTSRTHGKDETCRRFWSENLKGEEHAEDPRVDGRIILDWILGKYGGHLWTGFVWLRIRTNGGIL
jgi:hypothetical protein